MGFREDKAKRKEYYLKFEYGWKQRKCGVCNGSGYYDHEGSSKCGACDGTGKETYKPDETITTELLRPKAVQLSKESFEAILEEINEVPEETTRIKSFEETLKEYKLNNLPNNRMTHTLFDIYIRGIW